MTRNYCDSAFRGPQLFLIIRVVLRIAWRISLAISPLILLTAAGGAHAASVYRCVDAHGHLAYQDTPCAAQARQRKVDLQPQPLIDANAPRRTSSVHASKPATSRARTRHGSVAAHKRESGQPMSWECRAADGEVFYRHTRCPGSVPGDGVVRTGYAEKMTRENTRSRHNAWSRVRVHGKKIPRTEACRRIHSPSAAGRDGHQRDETVSTYDHLMGRDPCGV